MQICSSNNYTDEIKLLVCAIVGARKTHFKPPQTNPNTPKSESNWNLIGFDAHISQTHSLSISSYEMAKIGGGGGEGRLVCGLINRPTAQNPL